MHKRTCPQCGMDIPDDRSARAKYCSTRCSKAAHRRSDKPCSTDGCDKKVLAKGLCGTHYNRTFHPDRHAKQTVACFICDKPVVKSGGNSRARAQVCSNECRRTLTHGTPLPDDHWARWAGKTCAWTPPRPRPELKPLRQAECEWCGEEFETNQPHQITCSRTCLHKMSRRKRRAREHGATGMFRWADVIRIWIAGGKRCAYCDRTMTEQPDPDHVIPLSRGGRNDLGNIVPCCRLCNADKNDLTLDEWREDRMIRGKEPRRYELDWHDPRFAHLTLGVATGPAWRHATSTT